MIVIFKQKCIFFHWMIPDAGAFSVDRIIMSVATVKLIL